MSDETTAKREPIVDAVLADPVVKAVLSDPAAAPAVAEAVSPGAAAAGAEPVTPAPVALASTVQPGQVGTVMPTKPDVMILPSGAPIAVPTTTEEEDRTSAGQRAVNLIWETTQMKLALSVIWAALIVASIIAVAGKYVGSPDLQLAAVVFLFGVANLVTGFYFGRTNHQRVGGVGSAMAGR